MTHNTIGMNAARTGASMGWAALVNGVVGIAGAILLVLFFVAGEPFGMLNDLTSLPWALALLTVAIMFHRMSHNEAKFWSLLALGAGLIGCASVFLLQTLLVLKVITIWQQTYFITSAYGAMGVWMIFASRIEQKDGMISNTLAGFGIAIGAGWILANICLWIGGLPPAGSVNSISDMSRFSKITIAGEALIFLGYFVQPIWAVWLGRSLVSGK